MDLSQIEIERDFAILFNQRIDRPETIVPGDWFAFLERLNKDADRAYQEGYDKGIASAEKDYDEGFSGGYEKAREDAIKEIERMV